MLPLTDLALRLTSFAIVEPDFAVCADADQCGAVRAERDAVDVVSMLVFEGRVEFERCAVVENQVLVVAGGGSAERALLPNGDGVDLLRVAVDFADSVPTVPGNAVTVALLPVANSDDALGIAVPGEVVDPAVDDAVFALGDSLADAIPDPDDTAGVAASDVET